MKKFIIMLICMMSLLACKEVTVVDVYPSSYDEDKMPQEGNFEDWYNFLYPYFNEKG